MAENNQPIMKHYTCYPAPNHQIGSTIRFQGGVYSTDNPKEQEAIENDPKFGTWIFEEKKKPARNVPKVEPGSNN